MIFLYQNNYLRRNKFYTNTIEEKQFITIFHLKILLIDNSWLMSRGYKDFISNSSLTDK